MHYYVSNPEMLNRLDCVKWYLMSNVCVCLQDEDGNNRISNNDRIVIKREIVDLMLRSPEGVQRQLSEAISIIGKSDFPHQWSDLIPYMAEKFKSGKSISSPSSHFKCFCPSQILLPCV